MMYYLMSTVLGLVFGYGIGVRHRKEENRCFSLQRFVAEGHSNATRAMRCVYKINHKGPHRCWHPYEHGFHSWGNPAEDVENLVRKTESTKEKAK